MNRKMISEKKRKDNNTEDITQKIERELIEKEKMLSKWTAKTELGKKIQSNKISNINEIFEKSYKIREPEIVDSLLTLEDVIVDTAKTTRVVRAGRKYSFRVTVLTGNKDGFIGIGTGKDVDRFPAIEKAKRQARLNIKKIYRGSGSWEEQPTEDKHSVPFKVVGKSGSVTVTLMPAPKGTGLTVGQNIKKVMELAGIQNVWGKAKGNSGNKLNFVSAAVNALEKTGEIKLTKDIEKKLIK